MTDNNRRAYEPNGCVLQIRYRNAIGCLTDSLDSQWIILRAFKRLRCCRHDPERLLCIGVDPRFWNGILLQASVDNNSGGSAIVYDCAYVHLNHPIDIALQDFVLNRPGSALTFF